MAKQIYLREENIPKIFLEADRQMKEKQKKEKEEKKMKKDKKQMEIEMMQLIAQKDRFNIKLGKLNPGKKKDAKKIAYINIKLKEINDELASLQEQSEINLDQLDHGSKFARFVGWFKNKAKKVKKEFKKFYKRYEEPLTALFTVTIPVIIATVVKLIIGIVV